MIPVTIQNVTKRFGSATVLDGVSIDITSGEIFFLLGPSGCGKTTLLRCIAGFAAPDEGAILFGAENVTRLPPHRRNAAMVFQSYALWPHMSVAKNVAFGLAERKVAKAETGRRVREALASVRMENFADRKIHQLSGGQQQRVALARALVVRPRCLLLDEPLSNLDAKLRLEMRGEIRRICKESGLTAIYVTHDQKEALSIADRIAVLDSGRVRQVGKPGEVYRRPRSRFVADFIGETNFIDGAVREADEKTALIATALGDFRGTLAPDFSPKIRDAVCLSIRPESWRLTLEPRAENCVRGRIAESIYLGELAQHRFAAASSELKIFEINPRFIGFDRDMFASVDREDAVVLPHE